MGALDGLSGLSGLSAMHGGKLLLAPDDISGLVGWWRADQSTLWQDTGATTQVVDGSKVYRWDDKSGNGHNVITAWPGGEFTYFRASKAELNNRPAVEVGGSSSGFFTNSAWAPVIGAGARTVVAVGYALGSKVTYNHGHLVHWGAQASDQAYGLTVKTQGGAYYGNHYWTNYWQAAANAGSADIMIIAYDGSKDHFWLNGSEASPAKTITLNTGSSERFRIGSRINDPNDGGTELALGFYAEIAVYNRYLTSSERQGLLNYLSEYYGISLSS